MGEYKIGKDIGELFARVKFLEGKPTPCGCKETEEGETIDRNKAVVVNEDDQKLFEGSFIFKTNILLLLLTGRTAQAIEFLEDALEDELEAIKPFQESNVRTVAFYNAGLVNEHSEKDVFIEKELVTEIEYAIKIIAKAQSTTCHPIKKCTGGFWCLRMPWSLRAVDVNKTGMWHYIKNSNCGFTLKGNGCGEPVTGSVCI